MGVCLKTLAAVTVLLVSTASPAQNNPSPENADRQMVRLNVRVIDRSNHLLTDVSKEDFRVAEDGVPQTISFFSREDIPLTYALVVDGSGSMRHQFDRVISAAVTIAENNQVDDETVLIRFISSDKIDTVQEFTTDKQLLIKGLRGLHLEGGQSAVVDGVYTAVRAVAKRSAATGKLRRRALVLLTDGEDRASYYQQEQLFKLLSESDAEVFVIGFVKELTGKGRDKAITFLTRLANDTGGQLFFPSSPSELPDIVSEIARNIRTQYVIGYAPTSGSSGFHKVQVTVVDRPGSEKRVAVTRTGYFRSQK